MMEERKGCSVERRRRRAGRRLRDSQLLLLLATLLHLLCKAAVPCTALLTSLDAMAWTDTNIVASLVSPTPVGTVNQSLPVYDATTNTSLKGVYCVDRENGVAYIGSNVLHVYSMQQVVTTGTVVTNTGVNYSSDIPAPAPAFYFEHTGVLELTGWATACVFANQYELHLPTITFTQTGTTTVDRTRFYTVVHRFLRKIIRVSAVLPLSVAGAATTTTASTPQFGSCVVMTQSTAMGVVPRVVTPLSRGLLAIDDLLSWTIATQYVQLDSGESKPAALALPAVGQPRGTASVYVLTVKAASVSAVIAENSSAKASSMPTTWDIVGVALPDSYQAQKEALFPAATITERFAPCYAPLISQVCPDCVPVAITTTRLGVVVAMTSQARSATYVTLLTSGTACTLTDDGAERETTNVTVETSLLPGMYEFNIFASSTETGSAAGGVSVSPGHEPSIPAQRVLDAQLVQVAAAVCNVSAMVADDAAHSRVYAALVCNVVSPAIDASFSRGKEMRLATVVLASSTGNATASAVRLAALTSADVEDGTEEVLSLDLVAATRLLHLTVRRGDGSTRVYTYAAFGVSARQPRMVDAYGGTPVVVTGYGLLPSMACVFSGSGDATVAFAPMISSTAFCAAPPLTEPMCGSYMLSVRMSYTVAWAIPSSQPHNAVVSPISTRLGYLNTPLVHAVENAEGSGNVVMENEPTALIVTGYWFVNGTKYGLESTCLYQTLDTECPTHLYTPAIYINDTAVLCVFDGFDASTDNTSVSVSMDGFVFSLDNASILVRNTKLSLALRVLNAEDVGSGVVQDASHVARVRSSNHTQLPYIATWFVDSVGNPVLCPSSEQQLYAFITADDYGTSDGSGSGESGSSGGASAVPIPPTPASPLKIVGTTMLPFGYSGSAQFTDIALECPPVDSWLLLICVSNGTHVFTEYECGVIELYVSEGLPYTPVFVEWPSTTYYPNTPLLTEQPVVGVRDACNNVFSYLNDSVFVGPLTVQLFLEVVQTDPATGGAEVVSSRAYGDAWTLSQPLNNLFYITNISFPTQVFDMRFYIHVTADLPEPTVVSPPITARACEPDRQSVLTPSHAGGDEDSEGVVLRNIECGPCPAHGICNGTANTRAEDGYWRPNASVNVFTSCRVAYGTAEACINDGQCAPGYHGVLCGECAPGYHTLGRACRRCLPRGLQAFFFALAVTGMVAVIVTCVVMATLVPPSSVLVLSVRSLLLAVQVTSLFVFVGVPWPSQLESLFNYLYAIAQSVETMVTCFVSPSGYLVFLVCSPIVLITVVTLITGVVVRLLKVHSADPHRVSAVVLVALLHRKQERFHQLRHIIAQEMADQASGSSNRRVASLNGLETVVPNSNSVSASATRLSMSAEWAALQRGAVRTARPSFRSSPGATSSNTAAQTDATPTLATASSVQERAGGVEGDVVDAFAAETSAVVERLARTARSPSSSSSPNEAVTWEEIVVGALREGNSEMLKAAGRVRLRLLTRHEVEEWAAQAVDVAVVPAPRERRRSKGRRGDESLSSTWKSSGSPTRRRHSHSAEHHGTATFPASDSAEADSRGAAAAAAAVFEGDRTRPAASVLWKRVGMMAAYREMTVRQFRASWTGVLLSTASMVFVIYYLPLLFNTLLWLQCVSVPVVAGKTTDVIRVSMMSPSLGCFSARNHTMRGLAIAALVVFGIGAPLALVVLSLFLRRRYGDDVMYAAFPVIFFGDSTFDFLVSVSYMLTKLIAVIAVTQTDAPMMQMSVLSVLFAFTLFLSSMWSGTGESVVMRTRFVTVSRRSVLTISRLLYLLVCEVVLLITYLIVSRYTISPAGQRGFMAVIICGIGAVFALFGVVSAHQFVSHVRYARDYPRIVAARAQEQQQLLAALVRRYEEITTTIELYLKVCDRGLAVAQQLDTLSRFPDAGHEETSTVAAASPDENMLSFSSTTVMENTNTRSPTPTLEVEAARSKPPSRSASARTSHPAASAASEGNGDGPEALTHFSPYPELTSSAFHSPTPSAPFAGLNTSAKAVKRQGRARRSTAPCLSAAFRNSANPHAAAAAAAAAGNDMAFSAFSSLQRPLASGDNLHGLPALQEQHVPPLPQQRSLRHGSGASGLLESPVDGGNAYWVSAPRRAGLTNGTTAAAATAVPQNASLETAAAAAAAAPGAQSALWSGTPPSPRSAALMGASVPGAAVGAAAAAAGAKAAATDGATAGDNASGGPNHSDAADAPPTTASRLAADVRSGDYAEVQQPVSQPLLKRSDSLLLSIRCLEPEYTAKVQATRTALVEESRAVATAEYQQEMRERQKRQQRGVPVRPTSHGGENADAAGAAARKGASTTAGAAAAGGVTATATASGPPPPPSRTTSCSPLQPPEPAITIDSLVPLVEMDLASSFDPLAVPPLPLTRALTKPRPAPSSASPVSEAGTADTRNKQGRGGGGAGGGRGRATQALLAALQDDLEAELLHLHAMPVRDSVLDMDLAQLASAHSQLLHPISFWGGLARSDLLDSTSPLSVAGKSRTGNVSPRQASAVGATTGVTGRASRSQLHHPLSEAPALQPSASSPLGRTSAESPVANGGATSVVGDSAAPQGGEEATTVVRSSDTATTSLSPVVPPLPSFPVPQYRSHTTHHTAAEYMRRRSARTNRTPRSRSAAQPVPRTRTKVSTAATPRPPESAKATHAAEKKPKAE